MLDAHKLWDMEKYFYSKLTEVETEADYRYYLDLWTYTMMDLFELGEVFNE